MKERISEINPDARYTIDETTYFLRISRNTLKKYTKLGWIAIKEHPFTRHKYYLGRDIIQFWFCR